nr:MAG TPA: hypothetical protein [Caudoviricetes sp.]
MVRKSRVLLLQQTTGRHVRLQRINKKIGE